MCVSCPPAARKKNLRRVTDLRLLHEKATAFAGGARCDKREASYEWSQSPRHGAALHCHGLPAAVVGAAEHDELRGVARQWPLSRSDFEVVVGKDRLHTR